MHYLLGKNRTEPKILISCIAETTKGMPRNTLVGYNVTNRWQKYKRFMQTRYAFKERKVLELVATSK